MAGDGHQRIYRTKVPLSRAGIHVRGRRSRRLKINYRTTDQNRLYAQKMLEGVDVDDLDGGSEVTVADRSLMKGAKPEVATCVSRSDEYAAICAWIEKLTSGPDNAFATHEICAAAEKERDPDRASQGLGSRGDPGEAAASSGERSGAR